MEASTIFRWEGFYHSKRNMSRMIDVGKRGFSWLRIVLLRLGDSRSASDDSFYGEYLLKQDVDDSLHGPSTQNR
jgi:hypothetical protein